MPKAMRVKTRFEAKEDISKTARKIERNTRRMNKSMQKGFRKSSKEANNFKSVMKGMLAAGAVSRGIGMLGQGIQEVGTQFIAFDDAITAAAVRFKDIGPRAADFDQQLKKIKTSAREAGATTVFTAEQAAKGLDFLARAGFTSAEAMGSLNSMINLSISTGEDFAAVADMSSDLLGAFGLNANNTAQKIANLNRLNDVLVKTTNSANVTVENMFETMKQVGPIATGVLGASLEEVAALTAILGNSGIKGSDAMTALKNAYLRLAAPVGKGADLLKAMNITLDNGAGGAKKMTDLMVELRDKIKGLGRVEQAEILDLVFGKRAIAGGKNILDNIANIKDFEKSLESAAGTSQRTAKIMQGSLGNMIKSLGSALVELGFKMLEPFEKQLKKDLKRITETIRGLTPGKILSETAEQIKEDISLKRIEFRRKRIMKGVNKTAEKAGVSEGLLVPLLRPLFGKSEKEKQQAQTLPGSAPPDFLNQGQPNINIDIQNQVNAKDIEVDTTVKSPGVSGKMGVNKI